VWLRNLDVLDSEQIERLIKEIVNKLGSVDILINNAGITDRSTVEDSNRIYRQVQMAVNYLAPFEIIGRVLSLMRKNKFGKIINVSSAGGFMAMPTMSSYSASKFALEAASESLWYEMKPWGIHVTLIIPGFIDSLGFLNTTESIKCQRSSEDSTSTYFEHYKGMKRLISDNMYSSNSTNQTIAAKICKVINMKKPPLRVYVTFDAWLFFWFRKVLPLKIYHLIIYNFLPSIAKWGKQPYQK
ncbi:MAG: SDR family NAD(P)-dependent oxidoreductase, partial [Bdellovibrionales bacterium]|nr:SDR family NAD(P)-dependent oxidoreductase [Bdellovibrionales bacterium]